MQIVHFEQTYIKEDYFIRILYYQITMMYYKNDKNVQILQIQRIKTEILNQRMAQNYDQIFKIILVGDASVGKTNIVSKIVRSNEGVGQKNIAPTIGVQFASKLKKISDGKIIKCQIWDTAGQQQYRAITMAHYRKAVGALVVYDITKYKTFQNIKRWISVIRQSADPNIVIILVANKCDLKDQQVVTTFQGQKLAKQEGVFFSQTSAVRNQNIEQTFSTLVEQIYKRIKQQGQNHFQQSRDNDNQSFSLIRKDGKQNEQCQC